MDGFKKLPKIQHFKEGGTVQREVKNFTKRDRKDVDSADIAQDKAIVKKAIGMHDAQEHKGEKTDLSKLKKGGRAKKDCGTVNRYKTGGAVTNVYEAKKSSGDLDSIKKTKAIKPAKAAAPSGAKGPDAFKKGGKVKKYAAGSDVVLTPLEKRRQMEKMKRAMLLSNQGELISQDPAAAGLTPPPAPMQPPTPAPAPAPAPMQAPGGVSPAGAIPTQKRGGKVAKKC